MMNNLRCSWSVIKAYTSGNQDRVVGTWQVKKIEAMGCSFCNVIVDKILFSFSWSHFAIESAQYLDYGVALHYSRIYEIKDLDHKEGQPLTAKQLSTLLDVAWLLVPDLFYGQYEPSNLTDKELYEKAVKACQDYHRLYGVYPKKIWIHWERFSRFEFRTKIIYFPELSKRQHFLSYYPLGKMPTESEFNIHIHEVLFEAVTGKDISWDEAYFPVMQGGDKVKSISSTELSELAKGSEIEEPINHLINYFYVRGYRAVEVSTDTHRVLRVSKCGIPDISIDWAMSHQMHRDYLHHMADAYIVRIERELNAR